MKRITLNLRTDAAQRERLIALKEKRHIFHLKHEIILLGQDPLPHPSKEGKMGPADSQVRFPADFRVFDHQHHLGVKLLRQKIKKAITKLDLPDLKNRRLLGRNAGLRHLHILKTDKSQ